MFLCKIRLTLVKKIILLNVITGSKNISVIFSQLFGQTVAKTLNLLGNCGWDFSVFTQKNLILKSMSSALGEKICLQLSRSSGPPNTL